MKTEISKVVVGGSDVWRDGECAHLVLNSPNAAIDRFKELDGCRQRNATYIEKEAEKIVLERFKEVDGIYRHLRNALALYYLDDIDRLVKERLHVRGYVRYMDDMILLHRDGAHLKECLVAMTAVAKDLRLSFNRKIQITPLSQGIDFLRWHLYLTDKGRVVRRLRQSAKRRLLKKNFHA